MGGGSFESFLYPAGGVNIEGAGEHRDWNDGEAEEDHPTIGPRDKIEAGQPGGVAEAEGLKHTTHAVNEVHAEETGREKVEARNPGANQCGG